MVGLAELARAGTALNERSIDHLHRLVASWAPLADLSFGDLLLYAPCTDGFDPAAVTVTPEQAPDERLSPGGGAVIDPVAAGDTAVGPRVPTGGTGGGDGEGLRCVGPRAGVHGTHCPCRRSGRHRGAGGGLRVAAHRDGDGRVGRGRDRRGRRPLRGRRRHSRGRRRAACRCATVSGWWTTCPCAVGTCRSRFCPARRLLLPSATRTRWRPSTAVCMPGSPR